MRRAKRARLRDLPVRRAAASAAASAARSSIDVEIPDTITSPVISQTMSPVEAPSQPLTVCPVWLSNQAVTAIVPCGHCVCSACVNALMQLHVIHGAIHSCPVCRGAIRDHMRIQFSA